VTAPAGARVDRPVPETGPTPEPVVLQSLARYLGPVAGSIRGLVNARELRRSFVASGALSALLALAATVCESFVADAPLICPASPILAAWLFGLMADLARRLNHGVKTGPTPEPGPCVP
jgi:hypothetical protein